MVQIEKKIETSIIDFLKSNCCYVFKNQASATTGKGKSDLTACISGRYVSLEVKRPDFKKETTYAQYIHLKRTAFSGGLAFYISTEKILPLLLSSINSKTIPLIDDHTFVKIELSQSTNSRKENLNVINKAINTYNFVQVTNNELYCFNF